MKLPGAASLPKFDLKAHINGVVSALVLLAMIGAVHTTYGMLKENAGDETMSALAYGRRLLIVLETERIIGKKVVTQHDLLAGTGIADALKGDGSNSTKKKYIIDDEVMVDLSSQPLNAVAENRMMANGLAAMQQETTYGVAPVISSNGAKPWKYYSKPYDVVAGKSSIAIVIKDLGVNEMVTHNALRLPESISLSFSPYAQDLLEWANSARLTGHEIYLDLPLHPSDYPATDPGPYGILLDNGIGRNSDYFEWIVSQLPLFVGLVSPHLERFSTEPEPFKDLLQLIKNRGLIFLMTRKPAKEDIKEALANSGVPFLNTSYVIDEELSPEIIMARLNQLEILAKKRGFVVGVGRANPLTIQKLREWIATLADKDVTIVPLSAVAKELYE